MARSASHTRRWKRLPPTSRGTFEGRATSLHVVHQLRGQCAPAAASSRRNARRRETPLASARASPTSSSAKVTWQIAAGGGRHSPAGRGAWRKGSRRLLRCMASSMTPSGCSAAESPQRCARDTGRKRTCGMARWSCPKTATLGARSRAILSAVTLDSGRLLPRTHQPGRALRRPLLHGRRSPPGIYCRPVCPARLAASAERALLPPRRRRRPRKASDPAGAAAPKRPRARPPGPARRPRWRARCASSATELSTRSGVGPAGRARLGLGERQLRRLFTQHVGAGPLAVAATRRAHLAKKLLDETDLPATEIAFAAGYASVRRFNAAVQLGLPRLPPRAARGCAAAGHSAGRPRTTATSTCASPTALPCAGARYSASWPHARYPVWKKFARPTAACIDAWRARPKRPG